MPDVAFLAGANPADTDPEICACVEKLDETIRNITAFYGQTVQQLQARTDQALQYAVTIYQRVTDTLQAAFGHQYGQSVQVGQTTTDSLYSQALNQLTELVIRLQNQGIPVPSLGQVPGPLYQQGQVYGQQTRGLNLGQGAGYGTSVPSYTQGPSYGGTGTNATAGPTGTASGGLGQAQSIGTNVPGGNTVPSNPQSPTPITTLDRVIIVNSDGTYTTADIVRDPERPGVVWVFPSTARNTTTQIETQLPAPVSSGGYGIPGPQVAPEITPGVSGAGVGPTGSSPLGPTSSLISPQSGTAGQAVALAGMIQGTQLASAGPLDLSFLNAPHVDETTGETTPSGPAPEISKTDLFVQSPAGKNYTITGQVLQQLYSNAGDKLDYNSTVPVVLQLVWLLVPGGKIIGTAETTDPKNISGVFDPSPPGVQSCPPIQITLNPSVGSGPSGPGQCPDPSNVVSIDQPAAFRFEQRTKPWFRDAVNWMPQAERDFVNSDSFLSVYNSHIASINEPQ